MAALFSLADAKSWIGIDPTDTTRDVLLASLVEAASDACLKIIGRDPLRRRHTHTVNGLGGPALPVNHFPIISVDSVTVCGTLLPATAYTFDDNAIYSLQGNFPRGIRNIALVYVAGLDPRPASITLAGKYTVKAMWDAKGIDMNSTGESWAEIGSSTFWPSGPGAVPPQAISLLSRYISMVKL